MCGRFALSIKTKDVETLVPGLRVQEDLGPRFNFAPTQDVPVLLNDGENELSMARWGLIPFWSKDMKIGARLINARSETIDEKPAFRNAFKKRRCLIFADGFYEWKKNPSTNKKSPYFFKMKSGEPFTFAGLWESWKNPAGGNIISTTIITTEPNEIMSPVHNRMPVILLPQDRELWVNADNAEAPLLKNCLRPYPADEMTAYEVTLRVNNPRNDDESCIAPLGYGWNL